VLGARHRAFVVCTAALFCVSLAGAVRADGTPTLAGRWSAGPLTTRWVIGDWGDQCGPQPSGGGEAGTSVLIDESGGELVIMGGGRTFATTECWEQYPGVHKVSHAVGNRAWKTTCKTSPSDPRQASISTSITATDTSLSFYEAGQYQFVIKGQNCTASVGRYRTYSLVQREGAPDTTTAASAPSASASATAPAPAPTSDRCAHPGPLSKLDVRPARKLLRAGDEFTFRVVGYDVGGCSVSVKPAWAIDSGQDHADLTAPGVVHVHPDAPEGEIALSASVGSRSVVVTIDVASTARYDALLKSGTFNAAGEVDQSAAPAVASQSIGAASAVAEDRAKPRKRLFVVLVGVAAGVLLLVGVWVVMRARRAAKVRAQRFAERRAKEQAAASPKADAPAIAMQVAAPRPAQAAPSAPPPAPPAPSKTICPVCGTQYGSESRFCGRDGATLMPLNQ
jgi:hypothetical protein